MLHIHLKGITRCSSIVTIYLTRRHPRPWGWGQWVNVQLFHYMVMVHINLKRITKCSNMVAIILAADPHSFTTLGMGSIGQNSTLSEHDHVAYQIKWNHEMQQHGSKHFARRPPPPPTHTHTHTHALKRSIGQNSTFSEHGQVAY